MKILYLDCFSGISGDMLLGSLIDLGVPMGELEATFRSLSFPSHGIRVRRVIRQGIAAIKVDFEFNETPQNVRNYQEIREIICRSRLKPVVKQDALRIFKALAVAESKVHGISIEEVHFHEVGALDTLFDVVGGVFARDFLGVDEVYASPVPFGQGSIFCEHGILPNPAPATLELLKGFSTFPLTYEMEYVTPTGAAILRSWVDPDKQVPSFRLLNVGYGAGDQEPETRPNVLRAVLGEVCEEGRSDEVVLLETDIDDETPEVLAHASQILLGKGALDVTSHTVVMKKGRLGTRVTVVSPLENQEALTKCLLEETSTLGVRVIPVSRRIVKRQIELVPTSLGEAAVKVAVLPDGRRRLTPEYDSCVHLAQKHHFPLRYVMDLVKREAEAALSITTRM